MKRTLLLPIVKMGIYFSLATTLIISLLCGRIYAGLDSSGTEFFLLFESNPGFSDPGLDLYIMSNTDTDGVVEVPGTSISIPFSVTAGSTAAISLPTDLDDLGNGVINSNKGIHVVAQDEVTVYGFNRANNTTDAFLGLPSQVLGTEYMILSHSGSNSINKSQFAIIATEDNTSVTITLTVPVPISPAFTPFMITMNKYQTFQLQTAGGSAELDGSVVIADKPIAVFSGNECDNIPSSLYGFCSHTVEQLFPVMFWGTSYVTFPLATRIGGDTFRILSSSSNNTVSISGFTPVVLGAGEYLDVTLTTGSSINAQEPIMVAQFSNGSGFDEVPSDPFMMLLPSTDQFNNNYLFETPALNYSGYYVNVIVPNSAISDVILDGTPVPSSSFSAIGTSGFSGAAIPVGEGGGGVHNISCSEPIGVHSYGFADFNSYGYPAGKYNVFSDEDGDGISIEEDNCPEIANPDQNDTYPPPSGNNCGDVCECEGNFDDDQDQDGSDAAQFKADFGRSTFFRPCTNVDSCNGDFDCDSDVDGSNAAHFKSDFGRSPFFNPCPICPTDPWCSYP